MTTSICNIISHFCLKRLSGRSLSPRFQTAPGRIVFAFLICFSLSSNLWANTALTWNMEWFPCKTEKDEAAAPGRIKAAQEVIKSIGSDIMLFQEVNDWAAVQAVIATLEGYQVDMVTAFKGSKQQMAIASRYPVDSAWYEQFAAYEDDDKKAPPRGFAFAALKPTEKHFVLCYSVHLKSNRGDKVKNIKAREEGARQLIKHVAEMKALYSAKGEVSVIIAGDFNTLQDDPSFATEETLHLFLKDGYQWSWNDVPKEKRATWPGSGSYSSATFDHFFTKELPPSTVKIMGKTEVSDHCPVLLSW